MKQARSILAFIRHGEYRQKPNVPSAWQPFALTERGIQQSRHAAQPLLAFAETHNLQIEPRIHTSNLLRAWQTAEQIRLNLHQQAHLISSEQLNERSVGAAANLTITEIEQILQQDPRYPLPPHNWKSDPHYRLPFDGAESLMEAGKRVCHGIVEVMQQVHTSAQHDTLTVMVGHGASFRHAAYLLGALEFDDIGRYSMHYADPIYFEVRWSENEQACSLCKVGGEWKVRNEQTQSNALLMD
ncbi:histidine phosphatase family protein [Thiomicrorhabdus sp. zzn3]|uniref:histidine phosphatase family protein n=1 Tax=Thiomicrorhabdus sp. zzn3 TaxID=3039775 RepID=UPI0024366077|nr:histidine phosphatase family protein [Thiomicrorhabdus sp. zzn3]MDG6777255.1 histidine phosphatase family protein [Thiomicrorhabdus sp. zzn3]